MKFPSIEHLPWSQQLSRGDKRKDNVDCFKGKTLVYTEKMDGENTAIAKSFIHARSDNPTTYGKPWQTYIIKMAEKFRYAMPDSMIIYGENMYAIHSIAYEKLTSYFYVFAVLQNDYFLSWKDTEEVAYTYGLETVPLFKNKTINCCIEYPIPTDSAFGSICEGYVVRNADHFHKDQFNDNIAKCVRANHVQTDIHWRKAWKKAQLINL